MRSSVLDESFEKNRWRCSQQTDLAQATETLRVGAQEEKSSKIWPPAAVKPTAPAS